MAFICSPQALHRHPLVCLSAPAGRSVALWHVAGTGPTPRCRASPGIEGGRKGGWGRGECPPG